jgi:hypothetical protein
MSLFIHVASGSGGAFGWSEQMLHSPTLQEQCATTNVPLLWFCLRFWCRIRLVRAGAVLIYPAGTGHINQCAFFNRFASGSGSAFGWSGQMLYPLTRLPCRSSAHQPMCLFIRFASGASAASDWSGQMLYLPTLQEHGTSTKCAFLFNLPQVLAAHSVGQGSTRGAAGAVNEATGAAACAAQQSRSSSGSSSNNSSSSRNQQQRRGPTARVCFACAW